MHVGRARVAASAAVPRRVCSPRKRRAAAGRVVLSRPRSAARERAAGPSVRSPARRPEPPRRRDYRVDRRGLIRKRYDLAAVLRQACSELLVRAPKRVLAVALVFAVSPRRSGSRRRACSAAGSNDFEAARGKKKREFRMSTRRSSARRARRRPGCARPRTPRVALGGVFAARSHGGPCLSRPAFYRPSAGRAVVGVTRSARHRPGPLRLVAGGRAASSIAASAAA